MSRAYSYKRFSTPEQSKGDSLRRQTAMAADYCQRHGLTLDADLTMTDAGVSGFKGKNLEGTAALGAFLEAVKDGDVPKGSVLLVEALDRITRKSANRAAAIIQDIVDAGIDVVTLNDQKRYTAAGMADGMDYLWIVVQAMRAHDESKNKSRRVAEAWKAKREAAEGGTRLTSHVPGWIRIDGDKLELIPARAKIVRRIFEEYVAGKGTAGIAHELNADGVATWGNRKPRAAGRPLQGWYKTYVQKILFGKAAAGTLEHRDGEIKGYYPAAVSESVWARAQARHTQAKGQRSAVSTLPVLNILAGLGRCSHCGGVMLRVAPSKANGGLPKLMCSTARDQGETQCRKGRVRVSLSEVEAALKQLVMLPPPSSTAGLDDAIIDATFSIDQLHQTVGVLIDQIERSPSAALTKRLREREESRDKLIAELAQLEAKRAVSDKRSVARNHAALVAALRAKAWNPGAVNAALKGLLTRVVVDNVRGELVLSWRHNGETRIQYGENTEPVLIDLGPLPARK
jgi:DNA invertase Pin-like site-specific DNA recombinase